MIEKLERHIREEDGVKISCPPDNVHIIHKINELVDAVNVLQESMDLVQSTLVAEPDTHAENAPAPITLIDIFNEMGRLYAGLWNKMEDMHYDLKTKVTGNE